MFRRVLGAALVAALATFLLPSSVGAGGGLTVELESAGEPLTFSLEINAFDCDPGTFTVLLVEDDNEDPVVPLSVVEDSLDPNVALMTLPSDTVPGDLFVEVECSDGESSPNFVGGVEWHSIAITKVLNGTPPPGTTFTVNVDCVDLSNGLGADDYTATELPDDFTVDIVYPASGGVHFAYGDHAVECTITEPEDGGAFSTTIDPQVLVITEPGSYSATVTNVFGLSFTG